MLNVLARWSIGLIGLYHPIRKAGFTSAAALVASRGELPNEHTRFGSATISLRAPSA
jgi:hypothetical protein